MRRRQIFQEQEQVKVEGPFGMGETTLDKVKPKMLGKYLDPYAKCPNCERKFKKAGMKRHLSKCSVQVYSFDGSYKDYDRTIVKRKEPE